MKRRSFFSLISVLPFIGSALAFKSKVADSLPIDLDLTPHLRGSVRSLNLAWKERSRFEVAIDNLAMAIKTAHPSVNSVRASNITKLIWLREIDLKTAGELTDRRKRFRDWTWANPAQMIGLPVIFDPAVPDGFVRFLHDEALVVEGSLDRLIA